MAEENYKWTSVTDCVRQIEVLESTIMRRGKGVDGDPIRIITQYWSLDGRLLAEVDPCKPP